jgi:uncharacterized lipoprotein YddW (UPF0748 family)
MNLRHVILCCSCLVSFMLTLCAVSEEPLVEGRALWVTRFDYKSPEDVEKIIKNCKDYNFNQILLQVRGNGTVFYKSDIEPWAFELTSDSPATTGKDPGWNPLNVACDLAHKSGLQLHAYMNVFPAWRSQKYPPKEAKQLWTEHPDWFMVDKNGNKMIPRDHDVDPSVGTWYSFISPGIPEVKDYVVKVFLEVIKRYDIDGVHFDYIRYPSEVGDYSYDPISLKRFHEVYGKSPQELPHQWAFWRGQQVTDVVRRIYREGSAIKPNLIFSAAVGRNYEHAKNDLYQRSQEWLEEGILDIAMPMIYTTSLEDFKIYTDDFVKHSSGRFIYPGIGVFRIQNPEGVAEQVKAARELKANGTVMFAYSSLFPEHKPNNIAEMLKKNLFPTPAAPPKLTWK